MQTVQFEKVNIRDLIGRAGFEIKKSIMPPFKVIKPFIHPYYLDEDAVMGYLKMKEGSTCYILQDTCSPFKIRYIHVGETLPTSKYLNIIDRLGTFSDDLLFTDIVEYIFGSDYDKGLIEDEKMKKEMLEHYNCSELYDYIISRNINIGSDITYLYAMKTGDTQYFTELTD